MALLGPVAALIIPLLLAGASGRGWLLVGGPDSFAGVEASAAGLGLPAVVSRIEPRTSGKDSSNAHGIVSLTRLDSFKGMKRGGQWVLERATQHR
jgi:hypothetical protein